MPRARQLVPYEWVEPGFEMVYTVFNRTSLINIDHITCNSNNKEVSDSPVEQEFNGYS